MSTVQIDKDELKALLERVLITTRDRECYDRARQVMLLAFGEKK